MNDKTYNGWTNYETWCVALWLDNEEWSYNYYHEQARIEYARASADAYTTREQRACYTLADQLKEEHEDAAQGSFTSGAEVFQDLLNAALSEVNWNAIAEHYIDDVQEEIDAEEKEEAEEEEAEEATTDEA